MIVRDLLQHRFALKAGQALADELDRGGSIAGQAFDPRPGAKNAGIAQRRAGQAAELCQVVLHQTLGVGVCIGFAPL